MSVITRVPEPNIWDEICKGFSRTRPPFPEDDVASVHTDMQDYDPSKVTPVLYGPMHAAVQQTDVDLMADFDPAVVHPACFGMAFVDRPSPSPAPPPPPAPPKKTCAPRTYLEYYIFPTLLPALEEMLRQAKKEKCFERKRTKFNALDFLTEYLYKNNPFQSDRESVELLDIPFVQEWLKEHPRPPLPLSLLWTEEEAALVIQSHWRGYCVRKEPDISELRQWQKDWREENENIRTKVSTFWDSKMPEQPTPHASVENLNVEVPTSSHQTSASQSQEAESGPPTASQSQEAKPNESGPPTASQSREAKPNGSEPPTASQSREAKMNESGPPTVSQSREGNPNVSGPPTASQSEEINLAESGLTTASQSQETKVGSSLPASASASGTNN